tara:strand:+ start:371 stop:775 length:405 start_codon:yes stop_codon:yes gene_type:complete
MFFKNKKDNNDLVKIAALLVHAAKIDEIYTTKEEEIIEKALMELGATDNNVKKIMQDALKLEENSNQILDFTRKIKKLEEKEKIKILETLWRIIYSNNEADIYESSLMRRLAGLLYIDSKIMGDIKEKVKKENS